MNYDDDDDGELAELIQRPEGFLPWRDNTGRVHPVLRPVPVQPLILAPIRRRDIAMPLNGGRKKKQTSKNSRKYKNKNYKNKNRKRQRKTRRVIKKRK